MDKNKDRLIELIEAYAVAKTTSNNLLMSFATSAVKGFIDSVTITKVESEVEEISSPVNESTSKLKSKKTTEGDF